MIFYPSRVRYGIRGYVYKPEKITGTCMVNPIYRIRDILPNTHVLCDSGSFQDIDKHIRLHPKDALERQLQYKTYLEKECAGIHFEGLAIYDNMVGVDEIMLCDQNGIYRKQKVRGNEETSLSAIQSTLDAADYYYTQRSRIDTKIIWIAQGIHPRQYIDACALPLLEYASSEDYFGLGGFCIIGRSKKRMLPIFYETVHELVPLVKKKGIQRIHVFGVSVPEAIEYLHTECKKYGIESSTDTSAPEVAARRYGNVYTKQGKQMAAKTFKKIYRKAHWKIWEDYNPIKLAMANVYVYHQYVKGLA
jgi:hypothetical protein